MKIYIPEILQSRPASRLLGHDQSHDDDLNFQRSLLTHFELIKPAGHPAQVLLAKNPSQSTTSAG